MTKKNIYRLLVFIILIVIIDRSVGALISNYSLKYRFDNRIGLLLEGSLKKDIFIIGSSRALNGYSPKVIQEETNLSCYNLAVSGSNIEFHETVLDLVLNSKHKPKTIIYNLDDCGTLAAFKGQIIYPMEQLYSYVEYDEINKIVADKMDKKLWTTKVSLTYKHNVNFISAVKYLRGGKEKPSFEINNIDKYGSNLMEGKAKGFEDMVFQNNNPYKFEKSYKPYQQSLENIITKCKSNNVKLILVNPPIFFTKNKGFLEEVSKICNNDAEIIDYAELFASNDYFYNHGHLNKKGAIEFSKQLSKALNKN
jgi:hypothetical protein